MTKKKHKRFSYFIEWLRENRLFSITISLITIIGIFTGTYLTLNSYYHVEELEYVDADFEWVDDFGKYEITIVHKEKPHYLTVSDNKVKFIYANEDFLNFVIVNHNKKICDGKDNYSIKAFYINLNYKEIEQ